MVYLTKVSVSEAIHRQMTGNKKYVTYFIQSNVPSIFPEGLTETMENLSRGSHEDLT
jgi:hypothetical protein